MTDRAEAIMGDAENLRAAALELAIVDHEELDHEAQTTHAIMACLVAASDLARENGVTRERLADYLGDLLCVASALRARDMN